jgi:hypothetical protein
MRNRISILLLLLLVSSAFVFAQTWNGTISTSWNTAGNWSTSAVPVAGASVIIGSGTYAPEVPAGTPTFASVTINSGGTLNWVCGGGGKLSMTGNLQVSNTAVVNLGTCTPTDSLFIGGSLQINNGGTVNGGNGVIIIRGALLANNPGSVFNAQTGTVVFDGPGSVSGDITFYNVEITSAGSLSLGNNVDVVVNNNFTNNGSAPTLTSSATLTVTGDYTGTAWTSSQPYIVTASEVSTTQVDVTFSEIVDATTSQTAGNYSIKTQTGGTVSISTATRDGSNQALVHLTPSSALTAGNVDTLIVNNVKDQDSPAKTIVSPTRKRISYPALKFYSRANGNWTSVSSWSNTSHTGSAASRAPGISTSDSVIVGNSFTVTLDTSTTSFSLVRVDSTGVLNLGTNTLGGSGAFNLKAYGSLGIGSATGITASTASGNIQVTGTRTFSSTANYKYNGTSAQATGDGLPSTVNKLTISNSGGTVSLSSSVAVTDTFALSVGTFAVGTTTLTLNGAVLSGGTLTSSSSGTVSYNQSSNGQTVLAADYGNLTFSNFNKTLPSSGSVGIAGTFTTGSATGHTITSSTVNLNGTGSQTIPVFNYNNLTSSSTGARTLASSGTVGVAGTFTPGSNSFTITGSTVDFNGSGSQTIPAFNYNNLTSSSTGARTLASSGTVGVAGTFSPGSNSFTITGSTVDFNGSGSQTIPAFNYNNLTSSSTGGRTLASSGTVGVAGTFTPGTNSFTITGSTVDFNGTGTQTINSFNFNNLTISGNKGAQTVTLSSGTVGVAGTFSVTATNVSYTTTGNTVDFNGTGAQTVGSFNYKNLTISGAHTTATITLVNGGTIGIAGTFSVTATFTSGGYSVTGNTIDFNGASQSIPAFNGAIGYYNLTTSGSGTKTAASNLVVAGNLDNGGSGNASVTLDMLTYTLSITGTKDNTSATIKFAGATNGFAVNTGTIEYNGTTTDAATQTIGLGNYSTLVLSNNSPKSITGGTVHALSSMTLNSGAALTVSATGILNIDGDFTQAGALTNNGTITVGP